MMDQPVSLDSFTAFFFWLHYDYLCIGAVDEVIASVLNEEKTPKLAALKEMSPVAYAAAEMTVQRLLMIVQAEEPESSEETES
jgi:hypothetical protein